MVQKSKKNGKKVTLDDLAHMVASGFSEVRKDMHNLQDSLEEKIDGLDDRLTMVERRVGENANALFDLKEDIAAIDKAFEHDNRRISDHERRITRLEKTHA